MKEHGKSSNGSTRQKPLRLWPGVVAVVLQWLLRFGIPVVAPELLVIAVLGALVLGLVVIVWWAFFSRVPVIERWSGVVLIIVALLATPSLLHESVATGMMGMMFPVYAAPVLCLALVVWAVVCRHLSDRLRRLLMVAAILLSCLVWTLVRTGGFGGALDHDFAWRWSATPEEQLLAQADEPQALPPAPEAAATEAAGQDPGEPGPGEQEPVWPGFLGAARDGVIRGVRIATDLGASPPVELWRRAVGPGWSSFAVSGDLFYTQEQRGDNEVVVCYRVSTGKPVWRHGDAARFWESNGGAGPRGTPTLSNGRVYAFGATGILNVLDARDGSVLWSRNAASDTGVKLPHWGFSSSPLVVGDVVIVAAAGTLAAYDLETGDPRWTGPDGGMSYSSPQLLTVDGIAQVVLLSGAGVRSVSPVDGTTLWEHQWPGYPIVQPVLTGDGEILVSVSDRSGVRRLAVGRGPAGWAIQERWTSVRLRAYYSQFVVHGGHAFGFDGVSLVCIDLADGKRRWKGGRYGAGQLLLLADQGLLLVLSEQGELVLVEATPDRFSELARLPAIEGKTWNHPVLAGDVLLARNAQEMVALRLSLAI